ncbi:MAG: PspC domain-containing protein [Actinomycetes bacterium]|jgi:phage shock protein C|nr:PspC domain-containing protein [Actinomycetes bacterium]
MQPERKPTNVLALIIGVVLIVVGFFSLAPLVLGSLWTPLKEVFSFVSKLIWPLCLLVLGAVVVYLAATGGFARLRERGGFGGFGGAAGPGQSGYGRPVPGGRLTRSTTDRWVAGVCGGVARYVGIDPLIVRVIVIVVACAVVFWPVVLAYGVCWIIIPEG